jgi:hypothetical protein
MTCGNKNIGWAIKVRLVVAIILKRLASSMSNYDVASRYGIGKSTFEFIHFTFYKCIILKW